MSRMQRVASAAPLTARLHHQHPHTHLLKVVTITTEAMVLVAAVDASYVQLA